MHKKIRYILNYFGIKNQLKKFNEEVYELNEAVIKYINKGAIETACENISYVMADLLNIKHTDYKFYIKEELADVYLILKQIQFYFDISGEELQKNIEYKVNRTINRIEKAEKENKDEKE
ncbi:MAG: hypothetical protein MR405_06030 [Mollicutes bacterium]|nr:hypothetical protein [Mollicutes bacterium]